MFDRNVMDAMPLRERVSQEIKRRGTTQEAVANEAGMSLRTFNAFLNGHSQLQPRNRRAVLAWLGDTPGDDAGEVTRSEWPIDIRVFLDIMGAFLATMSEDDRERFMHEETRMIVQRWRDNGGK